METIDFNEVIRDPKTISVVGGLLPKFDQSVEKGLSTLSNGGRIIKQITINTGINKILILKDFSGGPVFELSVYNNGTVFKGMFYVSNVKINIAKTTKGGDMNFNFIVKNNNLYLQLDTSTTFLLLGVSNLYAVNRNKLVLEPSTDDLSSPNVTVTV